MKKFYFSYSILFTVVALAATPSVVQSIPEQRSVGKEQSTHDDHPTTSVKQPSQELLIVGGEQSAPDDHPYFVEIESNQYPTGSPTEPKTNPPVSFNDCDGNESLRFQLELKTDGGPHDTSWTLEEELSSDDGAYYFRDIMFYKLQNTIYTEPSDDSYYCLKDETCYLFTIYDSFGDGLTFGWQGYFKGFLNDVEVFQGGEISFNNYTTIFCVGLPNPTNAPSEPTEPPTQTPTQTPKTNPPVSFNDCDGNESLRFQLELKTDYYPEETTWTLEEQSSDDGADFFGGDYTSTNTIYTEPSDDSYYCLKDDTCYLFTIYDSWGDGWDESEYLTGYFKGFLNDVEVFQDGGEFKFYSYNTIFCVGMPTTAPTGSPTLFPSGLPTESCIDDKKKRTCKKWFRKGNFKKVKKKCNKKWKEIKIYDWCPKTCGKKAGVGRCAFLKDQ